MSSASLLTASARALCSVTSSRWARSCTRQHYDVRTLEIVTLALVDCCRKWGAGNIAPFRHPSTEVFSH